MQCRRAELKNCQSDAKKRTLPCVEFQCSEKIPVCLAWDSGTQDLSVPKSPMHAFQWWDLRPFLSFLNLTVDFRNVLVNFSHEFCFGNVFANFMVPKSQTTLVWRSGVKMDLQFREETTMQWLRGGSHPFHLNLNVDSLHWKKWLAQGENPGGQIGGCHTPLCLWPHPDPWLFCVGCKTWIPPKCQYLGKKIIEGVTRT